MVLLMAWQFGISVDMKPQLPDRPPAIGAMCCSGRSTTTYCALSLRIVRNAQVDSSVVVQEHNSRDSSVNRQLFSVTSEQVWLVAVLLLSVVQR